MNLHLSTVFGVPQDFEVTDEELPVVIGRGDQADIVIADRWVSRVHCQLSVVDGRLFVRDLESRHGTFVNSSRVSSCELLAGDRLEIGLTTFQVENPRIDSTLADAAKL